MNKSTVDIEKEQIKLNEIGEMLQQTSEFWKFLMLRKAARLSKLVEKIEQNPTEELFAELEKTKQEINHLNLKMGFEQREIARFENAQKELEKKSKIDFKSNLKKTLSKNLLRS